MVFGCEGSLHINLVVEIIEHVTIEVFGIVNCDLLRDSIVTDNILLENFLMVVEVMLVTGLTSTHFVKYSTATMVMV
jgi:hypothetical protein